MVETEPLLLSPPRNWPQSFSSKPLQAYLASLGGQRVRLCAAPDAALGDTTAKLALDPGASSLDHAVAARSLKGWPVVAGYAVYERDDTLGAFVAKERFWNARGKAGAWVDLAPRSEAQAQLVLVEAPALLARVPEPAPSAEKKSRPKPDKAEKKADGKYHGGTGASVAKAIETAARRDAAMERTIDKAVASVMDSVAALLVGEAVGIAGAEAAERRRVEAERVEKEAAERERQWDEAERRRAREEERAADAAKAPARADRASAAAARTLAERGGPGGCWDLGVIVAVLTPQKDAGARCFSAGDYVSALRAYAAAASAAEEPRLRAWQPVEALLLACRANAALCLLRLGRPTEAVAECDAGLRLPLACSCGAALLSKLMLRKAQALLDAAGAGAAAEGRGETEHEEAAAAVLLEARRRGLIEDGAPAAREFREQEGRLAAPLPPPREEDPAALMPLREVCELLLGGFHSDPPRTDAQIDGLVEGLATVLSNERMVPPSACSAEPGSNLSLLSALCMGLGRFCTEATAAYFERAIGVLFYPAHRAERVPVDMRLPSEGETTADRTALMQAAKASSPRAVSALLALGADARLRDARGVTALMLACLPGEGAPPQAAAEVARLLIDAGAPLDAQDLAGQSALMYASSQVHAPLVRLLLASGARVDACSATGRSALGALAASKWGAATDVYESCRAECLAAWPAATRSSAEDELRAMDFFDLLERVLAPLNNRLAAASGEHDGGHKGGGQTAAQEAVLWALLRHVGMEEGVLAPVAGARLTNFLEELHAKVVAVLPAAFTKVYAARPSTEEYALITQHAREAISAAEAAATEAFRGTGRRTAAYHHETLCGAAMTPHRQRGRVPRRMLDCLDLVVAPIRRCVSHAIPSREALAALHQLGPIVECGAGSGYWSRLVMDRGADVLAFDSEPPTSEGNNGFACRAFCDVRRANCATLFGAQPELAARALLLVWPYADADVGEAPWDAACLSSYVAAGGRVVAYVGEREEAIEHTPGMPPDAGVTASGEFQALLRKHFRLASTADVRRLPYAMDDLSIWERSDS